MNEQIVALATSRFRAIPDGICWLGSERAKKNTQLRNNLEVSFCLQGLLDTLITRKKVCRSIYHSLSTLVY